MTRFDRKTLPDLVEKLNKVEHPLKFTYKMKANTTLHFLGVITPQ